MRTCRGTSNALCGNDFCKNPTNLKYLKTVIAKTEAYELSLFVMTFYSPEITFKYLTVSTCQT